MKYKIYLVVFLLIISTLAIIPKATLAFWWFGQKKTETPVAVKVLPKVLNEQEKINTKAKYKVWEDAFEKKNIDSVIINKDKFSFTVPEVNYLLDFQGKNARKPSLTSASITSSNGNINVAATFHKFITGRFSFVAKPISVDNKIRLKLSSVKLYGVSVPTKWLEGPINKELDNYFSFLYKDARYQGFSVNISDTVLQFKPEFKK